MKNLKILAHLTGAAHRRSMPMCPRKNNSRLISQLLILGVAICLTASYIVNLTHVAAANKNASSKLDVGRLRENWGKMPLYFIENRGQLDPRAAFYLQGSDKSVYFHSTGLRLTVGGEVVDLEFLGANQVKPEGRERTSTTYGYFKGPREQWKTGLPTYREVVYRNLWPHIDLVYRGENSRMKYSFIVRPGGDPQQIRLAYRGATVKLTDTGELEIKAAEGGFKDAKPVSYQSIDGRQVEVETEFDIERRKDTAVYGFALGTYDRNRELEIDPEVIFYSGFIGGSNTDHANAVAVDNTGNAYVTGLTLSTDIPVTGGAYDSVANGSYDVFVAKVKADGTGLEYCLYLGGDKADFAGDIAVDSEGRVYIVGTTESTEATFPLKAPLFGTHSGAQDAFVTKINEDGSDLVYSTFLGGDDSDAGKKIAVNGLGAAYIIGDTKSSATTFPETAGAYDTTYNGNRDAFIAALAANGSSLVFCTYFGGGDFDYGNGIALDSSSNVYVVGQTNSTTGTMFPVTAGVFGPANNGNYDAFVAKLSFNGNNLLYSSFLGGADNDTAESVVVDSSNSAYVTGTTLSSNFPTTLFSYDTILNGGKDVFVTKINALATMITYSTYYGGANDETAHDIALDSDNRPCVTGFTNSTGLPTLPNSPDASANGYFDAFVVKFNEDGSALRLSTYLGGDLNEGGLGIAVDTSNSIYVVGYSGSTNFPTRTGPHLINKGNDDAFIIKLVNLEVPIISKTFEALTIPQGGKTALRFVINNANTASLLNLNFIDNLPLGLVVATPANITNGCGGTVTAAEGGASIELANGLINGKSSCFISVDVKGTTAGLKPNVSETIKAFENLEGNKATADITVVAPPSIAKAFGAPTIPTTDPDPSKNVTDLTLTINNPNATVTLTGVGFTDNLPAGLVVATPNGVSNTCNGSVVAISGSSVVSLSDGSITPLGTCQVKVKVRGTTPGEKINVTSQVTSIEGGNGNPATATITVVAPASVTKFFTPNAIDVGNTAKLVISIFNYDNKVVALTGVGLIDNLPSGLVADIVPVVMAGSCGSPTISTTPKTRITLSNATIPAGTSCQMTIKVKGATAGYKNNITDPVTSSNGGWGNRASAVINVKPGPGATFAAYNAREGSLHYQGEDGQMYFSFGQQQATPLAGDWDGDGRQSFGYFRDGVFFLYGEPEADKLHGVVRTIEFGQTTDLPVVGDWDGDGVTTIGVFRNGVFYLRNSNAPGEADLVIAYGQAGDIPVAGHFNALGFDTVGIYRGQTGSFHLLQDHYDLSTVISLSSAAAHPKKGEAVPLVGDWDGDGISTVGLFVGDRILFHNSLIVGEAEQTMMWEMKGNLPVVIMIVKPNKQ